jgi:branched-chain amino acid transport system ATP-binding protein
VSGQPLLEVKDLTGGYGSGVILEGVSLAINRGETVSVVGPNGAGKTTLLRAIYGRIVIRGGSIRLDGENLLAIPGHMVAHRGVAHVPEGRGLFADMTVFENISVGAMLTRDPAERRRRFQLTYELFPILRERRDQTVSTMSGGEQQMVAIARGLMSSPRLMMLDEPSLGLMPRLVRDLFRLIKRVSETGVSILLVEQNVNQSLKIADRGYVMEKGRAVLSGTGRELLGNDFVRRAFLGA